MAYAERTDVPANRSKEQIEKLVKKYGANSFGIMENDESAGLCGGHYY